MAKSSKPKKTQKSPKKSGTAAAFAWGFVLCLVLLAGLAALGYWSIFMPTSKSKQVLSVEKGDTFQSVLLKRSWQDNPLAHPIFGRLYLKYISPKPLHIGVYNIPENASFAEAVKILQAGAEVAMVKIQIIEGKTTKDLYNTLKTSEGVKLTLLSPAKATYSWADVEMDNIAVVKKLGMPTPNGNPEGWFAPDTYYYAQGVTDEKILSDLYKKQQERLADAWATRQENLPYKSPTELLTMASIIEKETGVADERDKVSAVFVNRLRQNMRLQTDPTIIYGLFDRYTGKIYKSNIIEATDYNTYQIDGLPPTPIALPSIKSINAAANPAATDVLFFVATGKGGHKFSRTLEEHNAAVAEYRKVMAEQGK